MTLGSAGGVIAALLVLAGAAWLLRRWARAAARAGLARGRTGLRLALAAIGGPREEAAPVILSLGLGLSVLAAVGQIDANLRMAIDRDLLVDVAQWDANAPLPANDNFRHFGLGQTEATVNLAPGVHTLQLVLADQNHIPHHPVVSSERITITVK